MDFKRRQVRQMAHAMPLPGADAGSANQRPGPGGMGQGDRGAPEGNRPRRGRRQRLLQAAGILGVTPQTLRAALGPPRSWKKSHNYHHGHVGQISTASVGAFPIMTTRMWHAASAGMRARYWGERHPRTVLAGYVTIVAFGISLLPLLRDPARHWDSAVALLAHGALIAVLWVYGGFDVVFFVVLLPMTVASALGSYLFFAQHSFKRMKIISPEAWTYYRAAMESSSYMKLNKVMQWFTGNIGYHHIHQLNVRIPFYRLPETMAAIPALQSPVTTSLAPREIVECFQARLWDEERQRMVSFREAAQSAQ